MMYEDEILDENLIEDGESDFAIEEEEI